MAVTIRDVAKKAGVSLGTVSRYLNGYSLRNENQVKIQQVINDLGFKENIIAKGLKNNRSMTIGVLIGSPTDIFATSVVSAIEHEVEKENYSVILCDYEGDIDRLEQKLLFLKDRSIDGLILFSGQYLPIYETYLASHIPIVIINDDIPELTTDFVLVNNAQSTFNAIEDLIQSNHKKIAIINGSNSFVSKERYHGYLEAMQAYQLPVKPKWVKWGNFSNRGGYSAAKDLLLDNSDLPTALFVANYYMTLGALMAINELNVNIPQDLSLVGFDNFTLFDVMKPALTVVEQPTSEMGETAARLILRRLKGDYSDFPRKIYLETNYLKRGSIRKI